MIKDICLCKLYFIQNVWNLWISLGFDMSNFAILNLDV